MWFYIHTATVFRRRSRGVKPPFTPAKPDQNPEPHPDPQDAAIAGARRKNRKKTAAKFGADTAAWAVGCGVGVALPYGLMKNETIQQNQEKKVSRVCCRKSVGERPKTTGDSKTT